MALVTDGRGPAAAAAVPNRAARSTPAERGAVLVLVMVTMAALLAAGAVSLYLQLSASKSSGLVAHRKASLFCAEAGLAASRQRIAGNYALWGDLLDANVANDPAWYPITGDVDGDGVDDYVVTIRDNDDELPPLPNDPDVDSDLRVFVTSRCTKYLDAPRQLLELVAYEAVGYSYRNQAGGGAMKSGNEN